MARRDDLPTLSFATAIEWEEWLEREHQHAPGLWLALAKKGADIAGVSYSEALDVALCFGWIDGRLEPLDENSFLRRFTPRGRRSRWSAANRERAETLVRAGRMRPAGAAQIDRARADGRWNAAYPGARAARVPEDLEQALARCPAASEFFAGLDAANRYAILYRIDEAVRPQTRAARVARYVEMLAAGEKVHP